MTRRNRRTLARRASDYRIAMKSLFMRAQQAGASCRPMHAVPYREIAKNLANPVDSGVPAVPSTPIARMRSHDTKPFVECKSRNCAQRTPVRMRHPA
jgi:hypothetical protein